jgi:hypothetical protein
MREPGSVELFEREPSLGAIDSVLAEARAGGGMALLIEGPAGIGKTALVEETQRRAGGFVVLRAGGGEFERDLPLGVVRQLFGRVLWRASDRQRVRWLRGPSEIAGSVLGVASTAATAGDTSPGDAAAVRSAQCRVRQPRLRCPTQALVDMRAVVELERPRCRMLVVAAST